MMKQLLKKIFNKIGFEIRRTPEKRPVAGSKREEYILEEEVRPYLNIVRKNTMLTYPRLVTLYQQAVFCEINNIPGDYVECGVWKGGSIGLMALANLKYGKSRRPLRLFDCFDDICEPDKKIDGRQAIDDVEHYAKTTEKMTGKLKPVKGFYREFGGFATEADCRELLEKKIKYDPASIDYHQGWFQETLPKIAPLISRIAILRLDGDWYASTKVCLEYLHDKVVTGGFVIIDDYGHYDGCRKAVEEFLSVNNLKVYLNHVDYSCKYWIKN